MSTLINFDFSFFPSDDFEFLVKGESYSLTKK